ncbi:hypothetical protein BDV93DRAFT_244776 [Ceratobasidium sp. AG-I]|nr:hypothetical protein BDV93DRAFT_244776 [Ceratobasidium sp. AG-I]
MAKSRSVRRRAALLRAGFSPEHSVPQVPLEPVVELVLEPTEPYVEVPRDTPPSPDALEVISDVSISPTTTPAVSLFSSSAFSTPKVSPVMQTFDEDLSENVTLSPTYVPAASTSRPKEYQLGDAPASPKPVELVFGASLSGPFDDGAQVEEEAGTVRHPKYSFPDGSLNCQVENTLFSIHEHIRELSPAMADLLPVDRPLTMDKTYFTRIHPSSRIKLHDVKAAEFEALLDMIYTP